MIAALMLYSIAISTLFAIAAIAGEYLLRLARQPARLVWILAMLAAIGFSAARFRSGLAAAPPSLSSAASSSDPGPANEPVRAAAVSTPTLLSATRAMFARVNAARVLVASGSVLRRLDEPLLIGWSACSMLGLIVITVAARRLARPRPPWSTTMVEGVPVLLSHDVGPAAVGPLRYRIVLPRWTLELPSVECDLVLAHEREHAAAGDPSLLFVTTVLFALMPWNGALWWMARRLRFAIELDCDARVLRRRPNPTAYGALLLAVSERTYGGAVPILALAEPASLVERRIVAIMGCLPRFAFVRGVVAGSAAVGLVAVACVAPHPTSAPSASAAAPRLMESAVTRSPAHQAAALAVALSRPDTGGSVPVPRRGLHTLAAMHITAGPDTAVIRGRVIGPDSLPIETVLITATGRVSGMVESTRTDADGRYVLRDPSGEWDYMMFFAARGFQSYGPIELKRDVDEDILKMDVMLRKSGG